MGLSGTQRERPELHRALKALQAGDTLVVPSLARLAGSVRDARDIVSELFERAIRLSLRGSVYDPVDALGKQFLHHLFVLAEFEFDVLRLRTKEGMADARAQGRLRGGGRRPKLSVEQQLELLRLHGAGDRTITDLAEMFSVSRATVYRILKNEPDDAAQAVEEPPVAQDAAPPGSHHTRRWQGAAPAVPLPVDPPTEVILLPWLQGPWVEVWRTLDADLASGRISADAHHMSINLLLEIQRVRLADAGLATPPMYDLRRR